MVAELDKEAQSKDEFFRRLAEISKEMIEAHGKDFTMGAFILAARWVADGQKGEAPGEASHVQN